MAVEIIMPPLSQTTDHVQLISWNVHEGDHVDKGQALCDVETDKVMTVVESYQSGTVLALLAKDGEEVPVGTVIAVIGDPGETYSQARAREPASQSPAHTVGEKQERAGRSTQAASSSEESAGPVGNRAAVLASTMVRAKAQRLGIDIRDVRGTGPAGIVTRQDLLSHSQSAGAPAKGAAASPGREGTARTAPYLQESLSDHQRAVAANLARSKSEIPHYYVKVEVGMDEALSARDRVRASASGKLSLYSIFISATARALKEHPRINGCYNDGGLARYSEINIAFAVAEGEELYAPVVHSADTMSLEEIDRNVKWLLAKVKNGKSEPDDFSRATFTISNLGSYAVKEFSGVITPGQAGILAIGRVSKRMHVDDDGSMRVITGCKVTGSFDHRIVNGASAAAFLTTLKGMLERG